MNYPTFTIGLIEACRKLDRLNSWVRSRSFRHGFGGRLDFVIYHLKSQAIQACIAAGIASHRLIATDVKCRQCGGTGRYVNQYGDEYPHCRACRSTGQAHLQFIETTIAGELIWHTPANHRVSFVERWWEWTEEPAGDWQPNTVGKDLAIDEAALLLNEVESFFPGRPYKRAVYDGWDYYGEVDDFATYRLYLGATTEGVCGLCGGPSEPNQRYGVHCGRIEWSAPGCATCKALHGNDIFKRLGERVPPQLLTPGVRAWVERHPVMQGGVK